MKEHAELHLLAEAEPGIQKLAQLADEARKKAYAPYSNYLVGAIVVDEKGVSHSGCNVENASYPAGICAERTAISKMISRGGKKLQLVVIVASSLDPAMPCGICRQVINEFGPHCRVLSVTPDLKSYREASLSELLPLSFSGASLES